MKVAVIGGGISSEHEVSLKSARSVAVGLAEGGHQAVELTIGREGRWSKAGEQLGHDTPSSLSEALGWLAQCDVIFPALHGPHGEDGMGAALGDLTGLPVVGSPMAASALAMDKWATKLVAREIGIDTAASTVLRAGEAAPPFPGECVVKPIAAGSSFGVSLVEEASQFTAALATAFKEDSRVLVEERIRGREIDMGVVQRPGGELVFGAALEIRHTGIFDTHAKYDSAPNFRIPAELSAGQIARVEDAARRIFEALGCRGVARVDFFLAEDRLILNEINTMPGMTAHSQLPKMFAACGMSYPEVLDIMIREAVERAGAGEDAAP